MSNLHKGALGILIREAKRTSLKNITPFSQSLVQFFPGGKFIDPVAEISALKRIDPANPDASLFRKPFTNAPLRVSELRDAVKAVARAAGLDPSFFGAHSLR